MDTLTKHSRALSVNDVYPSGAGQNRVVYKQIKLVNAVVNSVSAYIKLHRGGTLQFASHSLWGYFFILVLILFRLYQTELL